MGLSSWLIMDSQHFVTTYHHFQLGLSKFVTLVIVLNSYLRAEIQLCFPNPILNGKDNCDSIKWAQFQKKVCKSKILKPVLYLSIWIDSKSIVWDSSVVFTDNSA